jgi:large subunit ribosomal protein L18
MKKFLLNTSTARRAQRVRGKMHGTATKPRLSVYRSNKCISLQAINDDAATTICSASDIVNQREKKAGAKSKAAVTKTQSTVLVAEQMAEALKKAKISSVILDRGSYRYHGRVKTVAETLRAAGIQL